MISKKLSKVSENFSITRCDNGFMVDISGKDLENDWKSLKLICNTEEDLLTVIKQINTLDLDNQPLRITGIGGSQHKNPS